MIIGKSTKVYQVLINVIAGLIACLTIYPFIYVLMSSISSPDMVAAGKVLLLPKEITFAAYQKVFEQKEIWIGYGNTIFYTAYGTMVNLFLTTCGAYALSRKELRGRTFFTIFIALTMWFKPGMIPQYLNYKELGLLDTRTLIVWGFGIDAFNVILLRSFFESVPKSIDEAARIDGASQFQVLTKIYLPLSKAALATVGLFYAVSRWNGYFWAMITLRDSNKYPLQVVLKSFIAKMSDEVNGIDVVSELSQQTFIYATIVVAVLPIVMIYPYIQKYFVKGVMIGSLKG